MTPPRWNGPYASSVREELLRMVEGEQRETEPITTEPDRGVRRGRFRLTLATIITVAVIIPATLFAFSLRSKTEVAAGGQLTVATADLGVYRPGDEYTAISGTLQAARSGTRVCFYIDDPVSGGSSGKTYFIFPDGYAASPTLDLLDPRGSVVASEGDTVTVMTDATNLVVTGTADGCPPGRTEGALHIERGARTAVAPTTPPTVVAEPSTKPSRTAATAGCASTAAKTPAGAFTGAIGDVDGDGKRDTEWAVQAVGGILQFGITTASGATISGEVGFAGGGARSFVVGRLANGVVVAITSEGRDSPVYTFSHCAFQQLDGKDLLSGATDRSQFTLYSVDHAGAGGCFNGRLGLIDTSPAAEKSGEVDVRYVDVSADGRHAVLTDQASVVATGVNFDTDRKSSEHYNGISCGASPVLRPIYRTGK